MASSRWTVAVWVAGACALAFGCVVLLAYGQAQADREREARLRAEQRAAAQTYAKRSIPTNPDVDPPYLSLQRGPFDDGHRGDVRVTIYGITLAFDENDDVVITNPWRNGMDKSEKMFLKLGRPLSDPAYVQEHTSRIDPTEPLYLRLCGQWDSSFEGKLPWRDEAFGVAVTKLPWGATTWPGCERRRIAILAIHPGKTGRAARLQKFFNDWDRFKNEIAEGDYVRLPELKAGFQRYIHKSDVSDYNVGDRSMTHEYYHPPNSVTGDGVLLNCAHGYEGKTIVACGYVGVTDDERVEWYAQMRPNVRRDEQPEDWLRLVRAVQQVVGNVLVDYRRNDLLQDGEER